MPAEPAPRMMSHAISNSTASAGDAKKMGAKTTKAILWSVGQQLATNAVAFGGYIVLARLLVPKDFGVVALAGVFIALLQSFTEQGIPDAVVQRERLDPAHLNTAFWFNLALSFGLATVFWLGAPLASDLFHEAELARILRWLIWVLPLSALGGIHQALLKRKLAYHTISLQNFAASFAGTLSGVALALHGWGVWCLVCQQLVNAVCLTVLSWGSTRWLPGIKCGLKELKELGSFSVHITGAALLDFINRRADDFLIGCFLGTTVLGYYNMAYRLLLTFTRLIASPFNSVAFSAFSRLQSEPEERRRMFERLAQVVAALAFPAFLGLAAVSPDLVRVVFGAQWLPSVPVLQILCFIGVLHSIVFLHGTLIRAAGRPGWQMLFTLGGALTNLVGFYFVVRFGVIYVAFWYVLSAWLWLGVDLMLVRRILNHSTPEYLRGFLPALFSGLAVAVAMLATHGVLPAAINGWLRLTAELAAGGLLLAVLHAKTILNFRRTLQTFGQSPKIS